MFTGALLTRARRTPPRTPPRTPRQVSGSRHHAVATGGASRPTAPRGHTALSESRRSNHLDYLNELRSAPAATGAYRPMPGNPRRMGTIRGLPRCRFVPVRNVLARSLRPDPAATTLPQSQKARPPSPAIRPLTCNFLVAGAGFEPATSGL